MTMKLFKQTYLPGIQQKKINQFSLYTLTDHYELEDDCIIYRKSLLYLVSNALEEKTRLDPTGPEPLLGMEKFIRQDEAVLNLFNSNGQAEWILTPTQGVSSAIRHGDFSSDRTTLDSIIRKISEG